MRSEWCQNLRELLISMRFWLVIAIVFLTGLPFVAKAAPGCFPKDENLVGPSPCLGVQLEFACNQFGDKCKWSEEPTQPVVKEDTKEIIRLDNPLGKGRTEIAEIVGNAINKAMGVMGSLALVVFVYGGFRWLTAAGNAESVEAGTGAMVWATIGIFIIFASYAILQLVFNVIGAQSAPVETKVKGGAGGTYCLVNCTAENSCDEISQEAGGDFATLDKKCTQSNYKIEKKSCTEVAVCK